MDYEQKYHKYKSKYNKLKENSFAIGYFNNDGKHYKTYKTDNGNIFSFNEVSLNKLNNYETTNNSIIRRKDKILFIDTIKDFDIFTKKYGLPKKVGNQFHHVFIQWDKVSENFKGFYLNGDNKELYIERHDNIMFKNKFMLKSWWSMDYDKITKNIMLFR